MLAAVLALITVSAPGLVAAVRSTDGPVGGPPPIRISDRNGRVSVQLPKTWWEETSVNAGEVTSDETGEWVVPDLEASSQTPRWLSIWVDRRRSGFDALAEQHEEFLAHNCPDPFCTADPVANVTVDGFAGLRQHAHDEDGRLTVITTVDTEDWVALVMISGEDSADGAAELVGIIDSLQLTP
jgi:hypothetical protein